MFIRTKKSNSQKDVNYMLLVMSLILKKNFDFEKNDFKKKN